MKNFYNVVVYENGKAKKIVSVCGTYQLIHRFKFPVDSIDCANQIIEQVAQSVKGEFEVSYQYDKQNNMTALIIDELDCETINFDEYRAGKAEADCE